MSAAWEASRSRNRLWRKGEESGHVQEVKGIYIDCDADTILLKVHQIGGAACHTGRGAGQDTPRCSDGIGVERHLL